MNTEQKAAAYDNLLKAIEDKRLAVVPCDDIPRSMSSAALNSYDPFIGEFLTMHIAVKAAISAVDQKQINQAANP